MTKDTTHAILPMLLNIPLLIKLIRDRLGIIIHRHQTSELHKTILAACDKFHCLPQDYLQMLHDCPDQSPMLDHLIAGITVGETYFFRDKNQIKLLQDTLIPSLINKKRKQKNLSLRIWSAGCASGEEIYTIAILLNEIIPDIKDWTLNMLGTDINTVALHKAILGHYSEWSMRSISDNIKQRYFLKENNYYLLSDRIRDLAKFDYLNLNDDTYPSISNDTNAQDLILCRNVLIYFDNNIIAKLMKKISESLVLGGYLLLGASDPIDIKSTDLISHNDQGIYFSRQSIEINKKPPVKIISSSIKHNTLKNVLKQAVKVLPKVDEAQIENLLNNAQWQQLLNEINRYKNNKKTSFLLIAEATALANLGKLEEAISIFEESFALDSTNKYSYFTYALALAELNRYSQAEKAFRKTLFLDHQFVTGHYQLGLLLIKNKKKNAGLKCLQNALAIAKTKDPIQNIPGSQVISYGRLVKILGYEIEIYSELGKMDNVHEES